MRRVKIRYINTVAMVRDVIYYLKRGHTLRNSILLARDTL